MVGTRCLRVKNSDVLVAMVANLDIVEGGLLITIINLVVSAEFCAIRIMSHSVCSEMNTALLVKGICDARILRFVPEVDGDSSAT